MKIIRNSTTNGASLFEFDVQGYRYLVKNYTAGDVYASLGTGAAKEESILIPAGCAQVLLSNELGSYEAASSVVQIIADEADEKGVEVQCIRW